MCFAALILVAFAERLFAASVGPALFRGVFARGFGGGCRFFRRFLRGFRLFFRRILYYGFARPAAGLRVGFLHDRDILVALVFFSKRLFVEDLVDEFLFGQFVVPFDAQFLSNVFEFGYQLVIQLYNVVHGR